MPLTFTVSRTAGAARRGRLETPHGVIETPAFMPVGTLGAVKGLTAEALEGAGASVMLANLYHLCLRPGIDAIEALGGIHAFTGWRRPILTDSGGFQVFSLAMLRKVDEEGVTFRSHVDGDRVRFSPRDVVAWQRRLGVDIAMMLDDCPPWPISQADAERSLDRTLAWAATARQAWNDPHLLAQPPPVAAGGLFGIVQGSAYRQLRVRAAEALGGLDFDGYAIGGVSVGEELPLRREVVAWTAPLLPPGRPRYLMGLGTPLDIVHAVAAGVDLFDCVLPSRNARHGTMFTRTGMVRIKNARYKRDPRPLDEACACPLCRRYSRAFLHHMIRSGEITGRVLATAHNIRFYLDFMQDLREGIELGSPTARVVEIVRAYGDRG